MCLQYLKNSMGGAITVSENDIIASISELASNSGIFCEPAAAIGCAGLKLGLESKLIDKGERVVLLLTGNGLKDIGSAEKSIIIPKAIEADISELLKIPGLI